MIKQHLAKLLEQAFQQAALPLKEPQEAAQLAASLKLERPRNIQHGDYAVNVSSLARWVALPPVKIAESVQQNLPVNGVAGQTIGTFLNFKLTESLFAKALIRLVQMPTLGQNQRLQGERFLLEFVSANPTGPLHIGHGRWAALGDSIHRILEACGATVATEFYINDAGVQMENITQSLWRRCLEKLEPERFPFPEKKDDEPYPYYPGEYVIDLADSFLSLSDHQPKIVQAMASFGDQLPDALKPLLREFAREQLLGQQKNLLERFGVPFDIWYSEQTLHQSGKVQETIETLKAQGYTYEQEGALWLRSADLGDEKDRVLIKSDGTYTYLTADIAYHAEKFARQNQQTEEPLYNRVVNIWGADHHGYIPRMRASIQALGLPVEQFEVLLGQLVNLIVDGEKTRMGKRRSMLTLEDVIDEVGVDATRFWMVSKSADTALDFDVALAKSATDENPVFYVQYAHARCAGILRNAVQEGFNQDTQEIVPPLCTAEELATYQSALTPEQLHPLFAELSDDRGQEVLRQLILRLDSFDEVVYDAARLRAPHLIARYALDLSADFHSFYNICRILTPNKKLTQARLMLIVALKRVLAQALYLLGVSAPESM